MTNLFDINEDEYKELSDRAKHWSLVNGFILMSKENPNLCLHLPFTLFPSPYSYLHYKQVYDLQPYINMLMYKIGNTNRILEKIFSKVIHTDEFVSKLWNIYKKSLKEGYNQKINLIIIRTDYMSDCKQVSINNNTHNNNQSTTTTASSSSSSTSSSSLFLDKNIDDNSIKNLKKLFLNSTLKQVEINTMSAGFGYVSGRIVDLHREIIKWSKYNKILSKMPQNQPLESLANAFIKTWKLYNNKKAIILFLICDNEINIADQRHLEYSIINKEPNIEIYRSTLENFYNNSYLNENKTLYYNNKEISIVYFRAGYSPSHYKTNKEWDALYMIECSKAIKTPTIGVFLAGMKIVQQYLTINENILELIDYDYELNDKFQSVFGKYYKLNSQKSIEDAIENSHNYVLKPQREGGSNNYYDSSIRKVLLDIDENEKDRFVLMQRFKPIIYDNYIIKPYDNSQEFILNKISNELGIYGALVRDDKNVYINETSGYLLRSKPFDQNECGVMSGQGAVDSIFFYD